MTSSVFLTVFAALVAGALVCGIAFAILERTRAGRQAATGDPVAAQWAQALGAQPGETLDRATRLDMVERLAILREPWCLETLRAAQREERDDGVLRAIAAALENDAPG